MSAICFCMRWSEKFETNAILRHFTQIDTKWYEFTIRYDQKGNVIKD